MLAIGELLAEDGHSRRGPKAVQEILRTRDGVVVSRSVPLEFLHGEQKLTTFLRPVGMWCETLWRLWCQVVRLSDAHRILRESIVMET